MSGLHISDFQLKTDPALQSFKNWELQLEFQGPSQGEHPRGFQGKLNITTFHKSGISQGGRVLNITESTLKFAHNSAKVVQNTAQQCKNNTKTIE